MGRFYAARFVIQLVSVPPSLLTAMFSWNRTASLIISLLGAIFNFTFAIQLLSSWRSIKWESESEWEGAADSWRVDGVKLVWGLLCAYFVAAATACSVGFFGIIKVRTTPSSFSSFINSLYPSEPSLIDQILPRLLHRRLLLLHLLYHSWRIYRIPHLYSLRSMRGVISPTPTAT